MAEGRDDPNPASTNGIVELVVDEGSSGVPDERGEEDERYDGKVDVVVCFELLGRLE